MKQIKYTGTADVREFNADDLKKAGVEGFRKTEFPYNVPVEVEDDVADAILSNEGVFAGEFFKLVTDEDEETAEDSGEGDEDVDDDNPQPPADSGTTSETAGTDTPSTTTGARSTGGAATPAKKTTSRSR